MVYRQVCGRLALIIVAVVGLGLPVLGWELEETPATPDEWGYRPGENTVTETNPPSFTWRPVKEAVSYELEIAATPEFTHKIYVVSQTPWSAYCPDQIFRPGVYYWRYRGHNVQGSPSSWSGVRSFQIPEGAVAFPMPNREAVAQRIPKPHPRLFMGPEEMPKFNDLAKHELTEQWQALLAQADKLLAKPPDTSEPPKYAGGTERKGEEWRRIWWGNRVHAIAAADGAATLAFVYRLGGGEQYGQAVRKIMMALCDWDPKGATSYDYNDEAAMPLLYYPSRAYTWAYDVFTPEERTRIEAMMRIRGEDCYNSLRRRQHLWRPYSSHHNRAWHWLGEVATAFYDVFPEAPVWLEYSMTIFYTCYPVWGDGDGGWHEGQAYWVSYLSRFMYWALVMRSPFGINVFEKPFFKHAGDFGLYTCPPQTQTGAFGDLAAKSSSSKIAQFMGLMAAVAHNPYWQWYAEQHGNPKPGGYFGFLIAAQAQPMEERSPVDLPSSKVFLGTGLAALNSNLQSGADNVQIHFKSSPFGTQSHGYNANNSFLLNLKGERVLICSGQRDIYGSPHHRDWMWHTKSDNAILVNGEGQYSHTYQAQGRISHFHTSEKLDIVAGEAGDSYQSLKRWTRRIFFFKPQLVVIHDVLEAPEPSTYQWRLHAKNEFLINDRTVTLQSNVGALDISFVKPEGLVFSQKNEFDTPPHAWAKLKLDEWHLTAAATTPISSTAFVTIIRINGCDWATELFEEENGFKLRLALPEGIADLWLGEDEFYLLNAKTLEVRLRDDDLVR